MKILEVEVQVENEAPMVVVTFLKAWNILIKKSVSEQVTSFLVKNHILEIVGHPFPSVFLESGFFCIFSCFSKRSTCSLSLYSYMNRG